MGHVIIETLEAEERYFISGYDAALDIKRAINAASPNRVFDLNNNDGEEGWFFDREGDFSDVLALCKRRQWMVSQDGFSALPALATGRQLQFIRDLGGVPELGLTKRSASALIDELLAEREAEEEE